MAAEVCGFLKIEGLKGESLDSDHKEWIDVLAWSWGLDNPSNPHAGSGSGATKGHVHNFSFTKQVDLSSTPLAQFLLKGKHFSKGIFELPKTGGDGKAMVYYKIEFKEVFVTSINFGGGGGGGVFTENVQFSFSEYKAYYKSQKDTGAAGDGNDYGWNCKENKEV
ncbi:Hcp family type VI secretion system effector [Xanthobacter oligotrophicus]|uniref:Hcp family type VI secretion system effector n=1 Tax=Xanthobacter oligotrophicus TaxID=2607286 RepID=UPI00165E6B83|nr:type VI secretion system tube protein Hcp [Xanthobacter oligotrophicus]MCG5233959.1 type VI secretion system tube protein Hcp [Xanthobacter oligotrophicus]